MRKLCVQLINDEAGFVISAEFILISTIVIISLVVGLSQISSALNNELNDVANAFGSTNQSFQTQSNNGNQSQGFSDSQNTSNIQSVGAQAESGN